MGTIVQSPATNTAIIVPPAVTAAGVEELFLRGTCPAIELQFEAVGITFTITRDEVAGGRAAVQAALSARAGKQYLLPEQVAYDVTELGLIAFEAFQEACASAAATAQEFLEADAERARRAAASAEG